ncbi:hypothetical protein ASD11_14130 [Aeromicrobium sp. Root495]|uniref:GAF and ANTAR domain-containing protein n=1 Tax=Aeromicrobium sp. Root495 TaxID=1736550 RepID=UPI0007003EFB|nr:GAF and ANTAR domain-containing protein [Aeromicrobium sp. Root495]KQY55649.1 hypothetical protein ASD11_14130 [Aeromicrobium sp. Root495]
MNDFVETFAEFASALTDAQDFDDTADHLIRYAVDSLGASFGGITLIHTKGRLETTGATDPMVEKVDLAQYELGEGPCVDAATDLRSSVSGSVGHDGRWPRWGPAAEALGVRSVLSADMHGRDRRIGALNLYSTSEDVFMRESVEIAKVLADQSAAVMAAMRAEEGMRAALETRTVIGQAQGMLMERFGLDASQAFSVLRRFSQDNNIRLVDVAGQLVSTRAIP